MKNGKEIDIYVYKYINETESALWINNATSTTYRETLTITTNNLILPKKVIKITLGAHEKYLLRMMRKDPSKPGDFESVYKCDWY